MFDLVNTIVNTNPILFYSSIFSSIFQRVKETNSIIIIQYTLTKSSGDLIPCAQHICKEIASEYPNCQNVKVVFLLQLNRGAKGLVSYQSTWECVHIDETRRRSDAPSLIEYIGKPISSLFDNTDDWLHLIKGTIQASMEIVNKKSTMEAGIITYKIGVLDAILSTDKGLKLVCLEMRQQFFFHYS